MKDFNTSSKTHSASGQPYGSLSRWDLCSQSEKQEMGLSSSQLSREFDRRKKGSLGRRFGSLTPVLCQSYMVKDRSGGISHLIGHLWWHWPCELTESYTLLWQERSYSCWQPPKGHGGTDTSHSPTKMSRHANTYEHLTPFTAKARNWSAVLVQAQQIIASIKHHGSLLWR